MAINRKNIALISTPFVVVALFFLYTYNSPWQMVWDTAKCGESPIGFYRMEIVSYEYVDYSGGMYILSEPKGGLAEFAQFYIGRFDPCQRSVIN